LDAITSSASSGIRSKSPHQQRVEEFMRLMKDERQKIPDGPEVPPTDVRLLRAALVMEEAIELLNALGVQMLIKSTGYDGSSSKYVIALNSSVDNKVAEHSYAVSDQAIDPNKVADAIADISVTAIGTLSAFGLSDESILEEVDLSNLRKLGPGHSFREDGKLLKPPDWSPPDIDRVIALQKEATSGTRTT